MAKHYLPSVRPPWLLLITFLYSMRTKMAPEWGAPSPSQRLRWGWQSGSSLGPLTCPFWKPEWYFLFSSARHLYWVSPTFKGDCEWPCYGVHVLSQHLWINPIRAHGLEDIRFAWVVFNPTLLDQGKVFLPELLYSGLPGQRFLKAGLVPMQRQHSAVLPSL